jgi:Tat protein translocase TatB subunit
VFGIGMTELMVIFVIGLVVLGPKRLPELARSLGRSLAEFRRASDDMRREFTAVSDAVKIEPPSLDPPPTPEPEKTGAPESAAAGDAESDPPEPQRDG